MTRKVLITGVTGQTGSHLADYILENHPDWEIHGTIRYRSDLTNIQHLEPKNLKLHDCELRDAHNVRKVVQEVKPDRVFHLAATSFVRSSWDQPADIINNNVNSQINLFESLVEFAPEAKVQVACSSEQFGEVFEDEVPITENNPLRPLSPYAVSKCAQENLAYQYFKSHDLHAVITRTFNHSVHPRTPILIRRHGLIDIIRIDELKCARDKGPNYQEWNLQDQDYEVWADNEWTKINYITAHKIQDEGRGKKIQVTTSGWGSVETTDNHSIIGPDNQEINARDLKIGSKIKFVDLPETSNITHLNKDLAWLYGFFAAEGSVIHRGGKSYRLKFPNTDLDLVEKCKSIIKSNYGIISKISCESKSNKQDLFTCYFHNHGLGVHFKQIFYTKKQEKRVPSVILNSNKDVMLSFLKGYNAGDGLKSGKLSKKSRQKYEFQRFGTNSPTLGLGLLYLIRNTTNQNYNINNWLPKSSYSGTPDNFNGYYRIDLLSPNSRNIKGACTPKPKDLVKKIETYDYDGFVYDLSTGSNVFHAGMGRNLVHNTGPRRGDAFVESSFSRQVAEIENSLRDPVIYHGNLESVRDYTDARDVASAYWLSLEYCNPGEPYNICSSMRISIGDLLNLFIGLSNYDSEIQKAVDPKRLRPSDVILLYGDSAKFQAITGWEPQFNLERTMGDLLNAWRKKISIIKTMRD